MATGALIYSDESLIIANSLGDATVCIEFEPYKFRVYDIEGEAHDSGASLLTIPSWENANFVPDWDLNKTEITLPLTTLKGGNNFTLDISAFSATWQEASENITEQFPDVDVKIIVQQQGVVGTFSTQKKGLKLYTGGEVLEGKAEFVPVTITAVNGRITGVF